MNQLAIVIPCYNEEEVLLDSVGKLLQILDNLKQNNKIHVDSYLFLVDDGSKDKTWELICRWNEKNPFVKGLKLAKNVGHQNALTAGLLAVLQHCDMSVSIDADLQDDITAIEKMVDKFLEGKDIVYGVRNDRNTDTFLKRFTAQSFYWIMGRLGVKTIYNHADFRLMSKRALEEFAKYEESNLFLRGIVTTIGYETDIVYYKRNKRLAGQSKYPLGKMISFAFDGITSFSIKPINLITILGIIMMIGSVSCAIYALEAYWAEQVVAGWTSLILSVWFIGGVQLLAIGLIGQYIGKIYMEVKHRPRYHIDINLLE
ncbi:MAG: glycosyltransferase family 2 protein [Eubacteriales bacterium]